MRLVELRDRFVDEFEFPVARDTVLERVGNVELDAPAGEPESVADVLGLTDQQEFHSADTLYDSIIGHVGEQYIGRKYYDDRSSNVGTVDHEDDSRVTF